MPFGLTNAPLTFQLALSKIINDIPNVYFYIDDILIASSTFETHINDIENVLIKLTENNVEINYEKCEFGKTKISFLGHIISSKGIQPDISKLETLKISKPKTKKQLEKLLGFINWFRSYIPNLSNIISPFYDKLKTQKIIVVWTPDDDLKLNKIMDEIKKQHILHYPDLTKEFNLKCDASDVRIGSILSQDNKVVGFYSIKFKGSEKNYTIVEKKALGILESLKHFKPIIFGFRINIFTDSRI
ncbi:Retrovirus-related Pol polyprotein from transposon 17.6 [Dictyocoela muelleri]|nr:Retrovirus-related Pol polyprotein from transposon 17.6 [Dictyocoela muelleri]